MNNRNSLIWLFIYLHIIYQKNLVESANTSPNLSFKAVDTATSHNLSSYQSSGDLSTVVDSNEFGTGSGSLVLPDDPNSSGSSFSSTCVRPNLSGARPPRTVGSNAESGATPEGSTAESTANNEPSPVESGPSSSDPSPGSDFKSLYDNPTLCKLIQEMNSYELIDLVDQVTQKVKSLDASYNIETVLRTFVQRSYSGRRPLVINMADLVSTDEFSCDVNDDKVVYTPVDGYGFKLLRKNNKVLWHTNVAKDYATKIECDNAHHTVNIYKQDNTSEVFTFTPDTHESSGSTSDSHETSGSSTGSQETSGSSPPATKQTQAVMHPTVLNINRVSNCDAYKYTVSNGIITCIANDKYGFKLVRQNKNVLWHTINPKNYSKRVDCDSKNNRVTIYKMDETRDTTDFLPEQRDTSNLITIDVDNRWNTQYYTYARSGNLDVFTPNSPYLVRRILNKGMLLWWQRDNLFPTEIEVTDKKDDKRNLVIYFKSKSIEFIDPTDSSAGDSSSSGPSSQPEVKLFKADPSDPAKSVEFAEGDFTSHTEGNVCTYDIKVNCVKLMFGNEILWFYDTEANNGKYPKSLYHVSLLDTLVLNFEDFSIMHEEDDNRWVVTIMDTSGVKLFVADPNDNSKNVVIDNSQLQVVTNDDVVSYHFPEGTNCKLFQFNGLPLWEHSNLYGGIYPKSIVHYSKSNVLVLKFDGLDLTFEYIKNGWKFTESGPLAIKLHVVDPNDANNTVEVPRDRLTVSTSGDITTFNIADGVNCVTFMYGHISLWAHQPNQRGGKHPKSVVYDAKNNLLVLRFEGLDLTFVQNFDGDWIFTESGPLLVKLYQIDPNDDSKYVKLDCNQFTSNSNGDISTFTIANGVNCSLLKYGSLVLWEHNSNYYGGVCPKSVEFTKSTESIVIRFEGLTLSLLKTTDGWESFESGPLAVKFYIADPNDVTKNVKLASSHYTISQIGDIITFTIPSGVKCTILKYGTAVLWALHTSYHSGLHPKSLDYDKSKEILVLRFDGLNLTFHKTNEGWQSTESGLLAVKFYSLDPVDSTRKVLIDSSNLTLLEDRDESSFSFENGVKCVLIMYNFRKVWAKGDQGINEPTSVFYNMNDCQIKVSENSKSATYNKNADGSWILYTINSGAQASPPSYESTSSSESDSTVQTLSTHPSSS